ncbi:MAG: hypothetical protein WA990_12345 [Rubrobacteraceae bacterium]
MSRVKVFSLCLLGVLLVVGAGVATGAVPLSGSRDSARPPCEQLPDRASVESAVASNEDLVAQIESVGSGVDVGVSTPCEGQPDKAIVRIRYTTNADRKDVDAILQQEDGFGAPVELVGN